MITAEMRKTATNCNQSSKSNPGFMSRVSPGSSPPSWLRWQGSNLHLRETGPATCLSSTPREKETACRTGRGVRSWRYDKAAALPGVLSLVHTARCAERLGKLHIELHDDERVQEGGDKPFRPADDGIILSYGRLLMERPVEPLGGFVHGVDVIEKQSGEQRGF